MTATPLAALEARLKRELTGEVLFDAWNRGRYATDASFYQIDPLGVVIPRTADEAIGATAMREFHEVTGCDAQVLSVAREAIPAWDSSWTALDAVTLPPGLFIAANWQSRPGLPGRLAQAKRLADLFTLDYAQHVETA